MQTLSDIRRLLHRAGLAPRKRFGQCFLIDRNLMARVVELAEVRPEATILEVGPGTGSPLSPQVRYPWNEERTSLWLD